MSKIEWTDTTWNPVVGCTRASRGCDNCYAVKMTHRLGAMAEADQANGVDPGRKAHYSGLTVLNNRGDRHFNGTVRTVPEALAIPLRWRKPRRVFVNSMSDLFHHDVPFEFIDRVFAVMALRPQHTFQVLTKRPERMAEYLSAFRCDRAIWRNDDFASADDGRALIERIELTGAAMVEDGDSWHLQQWPLPNVWLGTSVEDQLAADERIPHLLRCPAWVRFLSCEPLLGPLTLPTITDDGEDIEDEEERLDSGLPETINDDGRCH